MERPYVLEHTSRELDRLDLQGILYRDITRRAMLDSGVAKGMRVLDIGCGSGDVARLASELVGSTGSVLGIDRDEEAVDAARARSTKHGFENVVFEVGEIESGIAERAFDALVGRFVLMHQGDPARSLRAASRAVRAGGVVVILESHMAALLNGRHSHPRSAVYDRIVRWKCEVVAVGADIESGLRLRRTFLDAGLPEPTLRMEASVEGGESSLLYRYMVESVRSMLPMAAECGVEGFTAEDIDSLEERLRVDVVRSGGVIVAWPVVSAWCRLS